MYIHTLYVGIGKRDCSYYLDVAKMQFESLIYLFVEPEKNDGSKGK